MGHSAEKILVNTEEILREILEEDLSIDQILEGIERVADDIKKYLEEQ